jgi:hypothetical protein
MSKKHEKTLIEVTVEDDVIQFEVDDSNYKKFLNASSGTDKVAPMHNFCMATVKSDDKPKLKKIFEEHGYSVYPLITGELMEQYMPSLNIVAKKLKPEQLSTKKATGTA